jgi:hypothetical protein
VEDVALACAAREPREDTALLLAIWARETVFGTCADYEPKGLQGKGDGGHGRGIGQIDDRGEFRYLIPEPGMPWSAFQQAEAGCVVLAQAREELADFRGAVSEHDWDVAVACRYNAKLENVRYCLRSGKDPNMVTTPGPIAKVDPATGRRLGDYGRDVISLRDQLRATWPETFPPMQQPAPEVA